jgi:uncharacterized membrane protein
VEKPDLFACAPRRQKPLIGYGNWVLLTLATTTLGLGSLAYGVSDRFFDAHHANDASWQLMPTIEGACAALAMLIGPWQFVPGLRWRWPQVHAWLGQVYAASAMASAFLTVLLAWQNDAESIAVVGLLALGTAWLVASAIVLASHGHIRAYQRWMVRSFVLTATTVCLRFCFVLGLPFDAVPLAVACLGWLPMLIMAEIWLCEEDEADTGPLRVWHQGPASDARNLGVEISIETLDGQTSVWISAPYIVPKQSTTFPLRKGVQN